MNRKGYPSVLYIHNWELDPETPELKLNFYKSFITYHNLDKTRAVFEQLLDSFRFTSIRDYIISKYNAKSESYSD